MRENGSQGTPEIRVEEGHLLLEIIFTQSNKRIISPVPIITLKIIVNTDRD